MTEPTQKAEIVYYDKDGVRVTNARFQVGGQTYAMAAVSSVAFVKEEAETGGAYTMAFAGVLVALTAGIVLAISSVGAMKVLFLLAGIAMVVGGFHSARDAKPTYILVLTTASGKSTVLSHHDSTMIEPVVRALNEALVSRG